MRLTCPNCDAQYEVPDDVIPPEGRDVQCSNCANTWFQPHSSAENAAPDAAETPEEEAEWQPEVSAEEPLNDAEDVVEMSEEQGDRPVAMASDAPDEVLAAAVQAALRRSRAASSDDTPVKEQPHVEIADDPEEGNISIEAELDAELNEDNNASIEGGDREDEIYLDHSEDVAEPDSEEAEPTEPKRRRIDPTVANILQEEAALEAGRRAEETGLESQPDLGLEEPQDDAAKRAQQVRERMAKMRGLPPEAADNPPEPIPSNSRRDLLPDIEEINSTLRATEDRAPEEQPDGRPTVSQRRAGGRRIGFALALLLLAIGGLAYTNPTAVSNMIPGSDGVISGYVNFIDNARLGLDQQLTKLMLWLDGLSSEG